MQVQIPVGDGHQYMNTAHMHNPAIIGEVCASDYAREFSMDLFAIRREELATEVKLAAPRMPRHERGYLEGYRDRLQRTAEDIERKTAAACVVCGEAVLSDQGRYSCATSDDHWHEGCYTHEPGDEEEPVKFFEGETHQHG